MKLTEDQKIIRDIFRRTIVNNWNTRKTLMFSTIDNIQTYLGLPREEVKNLMAEIPSIGRFRENMPIHSYVARHYRKVSDALFDGCSADYALKIWSKTKRTDGEKRTLSEKQEYNKTWKTLRKMALISELKSNIVDKYENTNWRKCK